ncbi:MAG: hypothetical protein WD467_01280 [Candidatus Saccharimonadales bacterium]
MLNKAIALVRIVTALLFGGLLMSLFLTNPDSLGPFGLTAWFSALLVAFTGLLMLGLLRWRYERSRAGFLLALRRSFLASLWVVALLALSSLRQLSIRDIILLTVLGVLIDFYMQRVQR